MPIKIYKDRVEIPNGTRLIINGTVEGLDASKIGAATTSQLNSLSTTVSNLSTTVNNNYSTLNNKFSNYLPLSGGTLSGSIWTRGSAETDIGCYFASGKMLYLYGDYSKGTRGLYDTTRTTIISVTDSSSTFYGNITGSSVSCSGNAATATTLTGLTATIAELNKMDGVTATTTELNYIDGVTSNIQTQLNGKVPTSRTINGKALSSNITLSAADVGALASSVTIPTFSYNSTTKTLTITG